MGSVLLSILTAIEQFTMNHWIHRLAYPKGVQSFRYFLQANLLLPVHEYSGLVLKSSERGIVSDFSQQIHRAKPCYGLQGIPTELTPLVIPCCINRTE